MAIVAFRLKKINESMQVGDTAYFCSLNSESGFPTGGFNTARYNDIKKIGTVRSIRRLNVPASQISFQGQYSVQVDITENISEPEAGDFLFFSKENKVNIGDLKGYFAETKFVNNSLERSEMFQVTMNVEQSSK